MSEANLYVRLKPHDPRAGHVLKQFAYKGILFKAGAGWSKVSEAVGEHLKTVRQARHDQHSHLAFDVCTEEEARRLDALDAERNIAVVPVDRARTVVARDEQSTSAAPATTGEPGKERPSARARRE